jgi:MFS family permease
VGAAYLIMNAIAGPIWAKLSDIWGRKLIILVTLALFFASSAASAAAKTMEALIVGRAFQGAAGGGFILLVHVCISDMFSLRQRSLLMGLTEGIWALAGGIGPVLGGVFASFGVWRWCCKSFFFLLGTNFATDSAPFSLDQPTYRGRCRYPYCTFSGYQARTHFLRQRYKSH